MGTPIVLGKAYSGLCMMALLCWAHVWDSWPLFSALVCIRVKAWYGRFHHWAEVLRRAKVCFWTSNSSNRECIWLPHIPYSRQ